MPQTFKIKSPMTGETVTVKEGTKIKTNIQVAEIVDSTPISVPVIIVNGKNDGPILAINSGTHGSEYCGMEVVRRTAVETSPEDLNGILVAIPGCNPFAYHGGEYVNLKSYDLCLGAQVQYPGDPNGTYAQRLAYFLLNEIFLKADAVIDNHDGAAHWIARYIVFSDSPKTVKTVGKKKLELAKAFGTIPVDHAAPKELPPTALGTVLGNAGIPQITPEVGGMRCLWPEDIENGVKGLNNIMKYMKMLSGTPSKQKQAIFNEYKWIRANRGGVLRPAFAPTDIPLNVKKGQLLATITNMVGDTLETIKSPYDGIVFCARANSAAHTGDWLYGVGK